MPDKYFVADANVIISAAIFVSQKPTLALQKILLEGTLAFSEDILQEYAETLSRKRFDKYVSIEKRLNFLQQLTASGTLIAIKNKIQACRDPKDDKYLELALAYSAKCIVTGDADLLILHPFKDIPVLTPAEFLADSIDNNP